MTRVSLLAAMLALTLAAGPAFPELPATRAEALAALENPVTERRAEAVVWVANHGRMEDTQLLLLRLRDDSLFVRDYAERGLWLLWSRSGETAIDQLMARGVEEMQAGRHDAAVATFSEVVGRRPDFAEAWNKRATVQYLAGNYQRSLEDCGEVIRRNPVHFGALSGYGQVYFALQDYEQAIRWWRRALEVNPNMLGVEVQLRHAEELLREKRGRST
ncbi:MAG: tetratricopeptide repeat protein [Betaproteobacteria bacterium]|nr:tetratricopeptide repeat protein [Betaproteobacteria bacterium]MDH5351829.1 tetratricopeptide repeat protein [Betaproteobacteria bacterium]